MAPKDLTRASPPAGTMVSSVSKHTSPKQLLLFKSNLVWGLHCLCCCAQALSSCSEWGYSLLSRVGFSLWWSPGSRCTGFSTGTQAYLPRGMWDLPGSGIKPMFPALAGGFLITGPPGKSQSDYWYYSCSKQYYLVSYEESLLLASVSWQDCAKVPLIHPVLG